MVRGKDNPCENMIGYTYQDILLKPRYSELESRSLADTSIEFLGRKFRLPVVPANMKAVINQEICEYLSQNEYFYIYHRFGNINDEEHPDTFTFVEAANQFNWNLISVSIGVNEDSRSVLRQIKENDYRLDFITIDVNQGWHLKTQKQIAFIKELFPETKVIAGNVCVPEAVCELSRWGADCVKCGNSMGNSCTTKNSTGFGLPMWSTIKACGETSIPIIADGSVKENADIIKGLVAGGNLVMCGALFSRCSDSPAKLSENGKKIYFGSASFDCKGMNKHIEGKRIELDIDVPYTEKLQEIKESIQSAISFAGGNNLSCFKTVEWVYLK